MLAVAQRCDVQALASREVSFRGVTGEERARSVSDRRASRASLVIVSLIERRQSRKLERFPRPAIPRQRGAARELPRHARRQTKADATPVFVRLRIVAPMPDGAVQVRATRVHVGDEIAVVVWEV
jgi:hypothetical protein